ncbi:MAG TPA: hypothetical protein VLE99_00910 [Candidatus Saccharimonadales bacterium]|nr:hypothetical protein [Candidatus Saccharimonadales bacterium]
MLEPEALNRLRTGILRNCFGPYDGTHASGDWSNNKLDLELLENCRELAALAVTGLAQIIRPYKPDLLIPVPNGANWLARELRLRLGVDVMELSKDDETKQMSTKPNLEALYADTCRLVVVEDVPNSFTNTRNVLALPWIAARTVLAVVGVWDRGDAAMREPLPVPCKAVISEHIPRVLSAGAEYWRYAVT